MKDIFSLLVANRTMVLALATALVLLGFLAYLFLPVRLVINGALKLVQMMEGSTGG